MRETLSVIFMMTRVPSHGLHRNDMDTYDIAMGRHRDGATHPRHPHERWRLCRTASKTRS